MTGVREVGARRLLAGALAGLQKGARDSLAVDAGLAALLALADAPGLPADAPAAGWVWFAGVHLPLVWRRRSPVPVFWTVLVAAVGAWAATTTGAIYPFAALLASLATLARHRSWRWWGPAMVEVAAVLVTGRVQDGLPLGDLATLATAVAAAVLLGVTVRTRQAYTAEVGRRAAAAERTRIAREVHDIVAHNLAVMVALADGAALTAETAPARAAGALGTIAATGREALDEMHRLLGLLRDSPGHYPDGAAGPELGPQPGLDDLEQLVAQVRDAGLQATLVREGTPGPWGPGAGSTIYRVVQESLTNTLKHAGPGATARVILRCGERSADLEITDDGGPAGGGGPADRLGGAVGHGLAGMAERVAGHHGRVDAGPLPGGGWRVHTVLHFGRAGEPR